MEFPRIGARSLKLSQVTSQVLPSASNCYCPHCKQGPMDGITGIQIQVEGTSEPPPNVELEIKPGTSSICVFCGSMVVFQEGEDGKLSLREINREDIRRLKDDPDNWAAFMKTKEMVDFLIEKAQVDGRKKYAGSVRKFYL